MKAEGWDGINQRENEHHCNVLILTSYGYEDVKMSTG
jgi:hypothetical protein